MLRAEEPRTFRFTYEASIAGLTPKQLASVWVPLPSDSEAQTVQIVNTHLPADPQVNQDRDSGNRYLHFEAPANATGCLPLHLEYVITRREVAEDPKPLIDRDAYLGPNQMIPLGGPLQRVLDGNRLPHDASTLGQALFDLVDDRMQYRKDRPGWGRGDAVWACDSYFGNCTDFHSLFIGLARTAGLPAKFEIGFAVPAGPAADVPGYHCWAFYAPPERGWIPVDISEANQNPAKRKYFSNHLDSSRFTVSTGRDLTLIPPQAGPPVNFLVYPYAEVAGQPWPVEKITHHFHYDPINE